MDIPALVPWCIWSGSSIAGPDLRNSKVVDIAAALRARGHEVVVHDPLGDAEEAWHHDSIASTPTLDGIGKFHALIGAVAHASYRALDARALAALLEGDGLVADVKGIWRDLRLPEGMRRWEL